MPTPSQPRTLSLTTLESRLPAQAAEGRKAIEAQSYGVVTINERSLALPVDVEQEARARLHTDVFQYHFVPITVGVAGLENARAKAFVVGVSLPERRVRDNDIWIVDVFPRLETVQGRVTGDAKVAISSDLAVGLAPPSLPGADIGAKIGGEAHVSWQYNPVFQSFAAVFSEAAAIWTFSKAADELKAGPIDLRLLVAVRKGGHVDEARTTNITSHIRAEFDGGLFSGRFVSTEATIAVQF